jgi:hypothetical protein
MKKFLSIGLLSASILFCSNTKAADNDLGGFVSALSSVTDLFKSWYSKSEELAARQDRVKYADIGNDIYRNLDRLILSKKLLIERINNNVSEQELKAGVVALSEKVGDLKKSLLKSEDLAKSIGLSATKVVGNLDYDFTIKDELLRNILNQTGANSRAVAITNLNKGIQLLEEAKRTLDEFVKAMEK